MNKVILTGNLTHDPELTETAGGVQICRFSIAVRRDYKNAGGEYETDFFNCQAWRGLAETVARYTRKGNKVAVTGSLQNRSYEDRNGSKRTATEIQVQDLEFLASKKSGDGNGASRLQELDDDGDIPF